MFAISAIVVSVERIDQKAGPYRAVGTVTRVWDPAAAKRITESMVQHVLAAVTDAVTADSINACAAD